MKDVDKLMIDIAYRMAEQSYCGCNQVGAVLAKEGRVLATGYNGTLKGMVNNCEDEDGNTKPEVIHAEQNLLCFSAKYGISTNGASVYVTLSPCKKCATLLIQAGIKEVVYDSPYRDEAGIEVLKANGVIVRR